jgi:ubiquitin-conjugating enzyme E2 O
MDVDEEDELVDEEVQPRAAPAAAEPPAPEPEAARPAVAEASNSAVPSEPQASTSAVPAFTPTLASVPQAAGASMPSDARWERFAILEEAPADHAFLKEKVEAPKKAFFSRLQKEFKILQNSLPGACSGVTCVVHAIDLLARLDPGAQLRGPAGPAARPHHRQRGHAV